MHNEHQQSGPVMSSRIELKSNPRAHKESASIYLESEVDSADLPFVPQHLEPTPIGNRGFLQAVHRVDALPYNMKTFCEDYIAALSHLVPEAKQDNESLKISSFPSIVSLSSTSGPSIPSSEPEDRRLMEIPFVRENTTFYVDPSLPIHPYQQERWMERYQELVVYHQRNGHCNVPYIYKENPCLGQWVKRQRHQYKLQKQGMHSNLNASRIQSLDALGFIWDSHGAAWEEKYQELKEFSKRHGNTNVPCRYLGSSKLSTWIKRQRRQYRLFLANRTSTMDQERIRKLEDLGFIWDYYGKGGGAC